MSELVQDRQRAGAAGGPAVVFAGGGSGGHLIPGVGLAHEIQRQRSDARFLFLRGPRQIEGLVLESAPGETRRLKGMNAPCGWRGRMIFAAALPALLARSMRILRRFDADTVVGLGGYGAVPAVLAGRALGLNVVLLEQNARPGLATRLLGPLAHAVCCAFPETAAQFLNGRATGNPVRPPPAAGNREAACRRFALSPERCTLLVVGGSQGARGLNRLVCAGLAALASEGDALQVLHLAGQADRAWVERAYAARGMVARVEAFVPDMALAYRVADAVVSRAGGTTLAELAIAGLPAVLVPYPHHRDRHQYENARVFVDAGAAFLLPEESADVAAFARTAGRLVGDRALRAAMARAAGGLARPDAARRIVDVMANGRGGARAEAPGAPADEAGVARW
ncbi:MAG: UDP-N-acetylglucosamine--N-acetylmuramyl-(pentapeptide) pyrophosphoryl-undecaprenol N-acetylglucosamine transferase [Planctomycetes bacterium]|nr:UDP-N-acetylglucosamine--N-acetylmuramyl-(pentapeptide) pyrophosphoryl-undecaprenol N-acetylglucosamine transferase [Planctomycetota bacterium]